MGSRDVLSEVASSQDKQVLRVLLLEDSRFDAELICNRLVEHFPDACVRVVNDAECFAAGLQRGVDLVLSDHELPGFGGIEALEIARTLAPDVPFVFVSGVIGEDNAVELLKRGATDYVSKQRLERLPMVVERALREARTSRSHDRARQQLHEARASLHEQQELLMAVLASTESAIFAKDLDGRYILANEGLARLFQRPLEEIIGQTDAQVIGQASAVTLRSNDLRVQQLGKTLCSEETITVGDAQHCFLSTKTPLRIDHRVAGVVGMAVDITERKRMEARLAELNATLEEQVRQRTRELKALAARERAIISSAATAIVATDLSGRVTVFNPAAEALLRLPASEALGRFEWEFRDQAEMGACMHRYPRVVLDGMTQLHGWAGQAAQQALQALPPLHKGSHRSEWTFVRADGSRVPGLTHTSVLRDEVGCAAGLLSVITDLSERKAREEQLRERTRQAESANAAKTTFLATMSHEFRTPLNAVIGLSQLLQQMALPPRALDFVGHIAQAGEQLLGLTNDVLDLSRIEAGEMRLEQVAFALAPLIAGVHAIVQSQAAAKGLALEVELPAGLPQQLQGDPLRLKQVLLNLLSNAVKFTPTGRVALHVRQLPSTAAHVWLRFEVIDTGIGITAEQMTRIFEPFTQADSSTTRRFGGSGLGLSIVRRLVEMKGGKLAVDSQPGRGSIFSVDLPLRREQA